MTTIYTIGFTRKTLEQFIRPPQQAGVDAVIDIRFRNTSQLAGFAERDDLEFLLREGFAIEYEHLPQLAPTPEIAAAYEAEDDRAIYEQRFLPLLPQRGAEAIGRQLCPAISAHVSCAPSPPQSTATVDSKPSGGPSICSMWRLPI